MESISLLLLEHKNYLTSSNWHPNMLVWFFNESVSEEEKKETNTNESNQFVIQNRMFEKCRILEGSSNERIKLECERNKIHYVCEDLKKLYSYEPIDYNINDICDLNCRNIPTIIDYLGQRVFKGIIYTNLSHLLVVVNPFKNLNDTNETWIRKYKYAEEELEKEEKPKAHIFAKAKMILKNLNIAHKKNQYVIISGESGSGKTEACKNVMKYIAYDEGKEDKKISQIILNTNILLELFGNAKTIHNKNSSRFGKAIKLYIDENTNTVKNGYIKTFLLEKSRIIKQEKEERNFHIFYEMLRYLESSKDPTSTVLKQKFSAYSTCIEDYQFLNKSKYVKEESEENRFTEIIKAFQYLNLDNSEISDIVSILFGVLLLGNVEIEEVENNDGTTKGFIRNQDIFKKACHSLFLDDQTVQTILSTKITIIGKSEIKACFTKEEMEIMILSFSKIIYYNLFNWIIERINELIGPSTKSSSIKIAQSGKTEEDKEQKNNNEEEVNPFIGLLDIFGFEIFSKNSLEQLLINIANERIQEFFIQVVFQKESEVYKEEMIEIPPLNYKSNEPLLNILYKGSISILNLLEDSCLTKNSTDLSFTMACNKHFDIMNAGTKDQNLFNPKNYSGFGNPNETKGTSNTTSKFSLFRKTQSSQIETENIDSTIMGNETIQRTQSQIYIKNKSSSVKKFCIVHSIGKIEYSTDDFIFKNKDIIKPEFVDISKGSKNTIFQSLFKDCFIEKGKLSKGLLISSQYIKQLDALINDIKICELHFIRCLKSNEHNLPNQFDQRKVFSQCYALSLFHALQLKNMCFSYKYTFDDFVNQYQLLFLLDKNIQGEVNSMKEKDPINKVLQLVRCYKIPESTYRIGRTKIFLNLEAIELFKKAMSTFYNTWKPIVSVVYAVLQKQKKKESLQNILVHLPRVQAYIRRYLMLKKHSNYTGMKKQIS